VRLQNDSERTAFKARRDPPSLVAPVPCYDFVLAPSFHGATLLALLLSGHPDVVDPGDTNPSRPDVWCSCGRRLLACPFWTAVLERVPPRRSASGKMLPTVPELTTKGSVNVRIAAAMSMATIHSPLNVWGLAGGRLDEYMALWTEFWEAALLTSGARFPVDGEKSVTKFLAFRSVPELDVRLIHLTRDPRAFAHSVNRHRTEKGMQPKIASAIAASWSKGHKNILRAARGLTDRQYLRVRYEDLATDTPTTMKRIFAFIGVPDIDVRGRQANTHVFGNAMASNFTGEVRLDTAWESGVSIADQQLLARSTEPLFSRLGYR
jgi:hypothetical protein